MILSNPNFSTSSIDSKSSSGLAGFLQFDAMNTRGSVSVDADFFSVCVEDSADFFVWLWVICENVGQPLVDENCFIFYVHVHNIMIIGFYFDNILSVFVECGS